jgi:hypothetical protein
MLCFPQESRVGLSKATADALMEEFFGERRKEREVEVRQGQNYWLCGKGRQQLRESYCHCKLKKKNLLTYKMTVVRYNCSWANPWSTPFNCRMLW